MDFSHVLAWTVFTVFVLALLAVDLLFLHRKAHEIRLREALLGTLIPIVAAAGFAVLLFMAYDNHWFHLGILPENLSPKEFDFYPDTGPEALLLFITGYIIELSLSADNVFLFVIIMNFFVVPKHLQHRVLFWGVLGALLLRAAMILAGTALLNQFAWLIYVFGAFLVFTGIRMMFSGEDEKRDPSNALPIRIARKLMPIHPGYVEQHFITVINGKRFATTLFLVLITIEFTDLVFALDSIPAIFAITKDPFIVFTSNVFAILGLRSMYFLLAGVIHKFYLLKLGLSIILTFVGVKTLLPGAADITTHFTNVEHHWHMNKYLSLGVVIGVLTLSVVASLLFPRKEKPHTAGPAPQSGNT